MWGLSFLNHNGWGKQATFSKTKGIDNGFLENETDFGLDYRIYLGRDGDNLLIILGGGTRDRQQRDIAAAKAYRQDYVELSVIVSHHPDAAMHHMAP